MTSIALSGVETNYRYTAASRDARAWVVRLLGTTSGLENYIVPDSHTHPAAIAAALAYARHLTKSATLNADRGDALSCAILSRPLLESLITLAWIAKDRDVASIVWSLDDVRVRLLQHSEVVAIEEQEKTLQSSHQSPGTLEAETISNLKARDRYARNALKDMPECEERLARLGVGKQVNRMPGLKEQAGVAGLSYAYALAYRFESNMASHPSPAAIEQYIEAVDGGWRILDAQDGRRPDSYLHVGFLFKSVLEATADVVRFDGLEETLSEMDAALPQLIALQQEV